MLDSRTTNASAASTAFDRLEQLVKQLARAHPKLGLGFGYIGNLERWGDDRSWLVFTTCIRSTGPLKSVSWGGFDTAKLEQMADLADRNLTAWCTMVEAQIEQGTLVTRRPQA
jgi:hypothetical protein